MHTVVWDYINAFAEPTGRKSKTHYIDPESQGTKTLCGVEIPHGGAYADGGMGAPDCKRCEKKYDRMYT
jgi:hypothetical protein